MIGLSVEEALEILRRLMLAMPRNYELHKAIENKKEGGIEEEGWIISFMEPHFTGFQAILLAEALRGTLESTVGYTVSTNVVRIFKKDS